MPAESRFQEPMEPFAGLEPFSQTLQLKSHGLRLFFYQAGQKNNPALLMIHGLGDEADTWRHIIKPLSKDYYIIAPDLPGFGRSDKPDLVYSPELMMACVLGLIEELNIEKVTLMGSSLGAILAQGIALKQQDCVNGLILVGGSLIQHKRMGNFGLRLMQLPFLGEWLYTRLRKNPNAAYDSLRNVYYDINSLPTSDQDFLFRRVNQRVWSDGQRRAYFSTLRHLTPWLKQMQSALPHHLAELQVPTLIIRGEHDALFSEKNLQAILEHLPDGQNITIPDVGHLPQQEDPQRFLSSVQTWLKTKIPPKAYLTNKER